MIEYCDCDYCDAVGPPLPKNECISSSGKSAEIDSKKTPEVEQEPFGDAPKSIAEWQKAARKTSGSAGFGNGPRDPFMDLALIHEETSEAVKLARAKDFDPKSQWTRADGKPEGFPSELADIVLRVFEMAEAHGIDMQDAMVKKNEFNKKRRWNTRV
jgi:NTP pyrophosphatase (non-canonical NTP hydrolase)